MNAALALAVRVGPILPVCERGKEPLTAHAVYDASTDPAQIRRWLIRYPGCNWAIATGAPGPTVLDVDSAEKARQLAHTPGVADAPTVATARGRHYYFAGQARGTITLSFGELRGQGSYVVCPPSIHESGKVYIWLLEPRGPLPPVPVRAIRAERAATAGCGEHEAPEGRVPHGQRHDYLKDFAVRLARAGVVDQARMLAHIQCEFAHSCEPLPAPERGSLKALAKWAIKSRIAERERRSQEIEETNPDSFWSGRRSA